MSARSIELDRFVTDYAAPLLRAAGFRKKARTFTRANDLGDEAFAQFRSFSTGREVGFLLDLAVVVEPFRDYAQSENRDLRPHTMPTLGEAFWSTQVHGPRRPDGLPGRWQFSDEFERITCGEELASTLHTTAIPVLGALLDRDALFDVVDHPSSRIGGSFLQSPALLFGDRLSPSDLTIAVNGLGESVDDSLRSWAVGRSLQREEDGRRPWPRDVLDEMLGRHVTPTMESAGFARTPYGYCRRSANGDLGLIEVKLSAASTSPGVCFSVDSAVLPLPEWEWLRHYLPIRFVRPTASVGWLAERLSPPAAFSLGYAADSVLGLNRWSFVDDDNAEECGDELARAFARHTVPRLHALLDRTVLLDQMLSRDRLPGVPRDHAELILRVDDGPAAALMPVLASISRYTPEFAQWVRQRWDARHRSEGLAP